MSPLDGRWYPFQWERASLRWVPAGDPDDEMEVRVFYGPEKVVAVMRLRRWSKVVYCEPGLLPTWDAIGERGRREALMAFVRRGLSAAVKGGESSPFPDSKFAKDWPAVYEYMTESKYPDGTARKTSSLTLFCEDCQLKLCLTEKNEGLVLFAAGKTLQTALNALDGLLAGEETPWRKSQYGATQRGGKAKGGA